MDAHAKHDRLMRFSVYELDLDSGELLKQGRRIKLQGQPFELLVTLLKSPDQVLTREELRHRIWPSATAGDFDQGLNRAINKVREALGDSAENPRFIETLPRRGYRFIGSIEERRTIESENSASPATVVPEQLGLVLSEQQLKSRRNRWISGATLASILAFSTAGVWLLFHRSSSVPIQLQQITTNSFENPILHAAISPDGRYLAYGDLTGIRIRLIGTGESYTLPKPPAVSSADLWMPQSWFPDGTHLLASSEHSTPNQDTVTAWSVSVVGGSAIPLREGALAQSISPDGSTIAFTTGASSHYWTADTVTDIVRQASDIWLMDSQGGAARKVVRGGADVLYFGSVRWSPDGKRLAYQEVLRNARGLASNCSIKSVDVNGAAPSVIVTYHQQQPLSGQRADFAWLPDDRIVYAVAEASSISQDTNLWQLKVDRQTGRARGQPQKVTNLFGFRISSSSYTSDGRHLVFENTKDRSRIQLGRLDATGKLVDTRVLTLDERNNAPWAFTPDSRAVIFSSDRTGDWAFYRQALDANFPELLRTGGDIVPVTRLSPDSAFLIYSDQSGRYMRSPLTGAPATLLFEDKSGGDFNCPQRYGLPCLISDIDADRKQQTFFSFNPVSGSRQQLFKLVASSLGLANPTISPDGSQVAMVRYDRHAHIEIRSLDGQIKKRFDVKGWPDALSVDWAADGKALFISHPGLKALPSGSIGVTLLRVDLQGNAQPIWDTTTARASWGIASPDGKYLAIWQPALDGNIWRLDNF